MEVDIHKLFNEEMPSKIARNRAAAQSIGEKFQFNITGDGGGEWFVDVASDNPRCQQGNPGGATYIISMSAEDFQRYVENPSSNDMELFFSGKMRVMFVSPAKYELGELIFKLSRLFSPDFIQSEDDAEDS